MKTSFLKLMVFSVIALIFVVIISAIGVQKTKASSVNEVQAHALDVYTNANYTGNNCYSDTPLSANINALCDNAITSINLYAGWSVRVYRDQNQTGPNVCINHYEYDLTLGTYDDGSALNDTISSFTLYNQPWCGGSSASAWPMEVYNDANYSGQRCYQWDASSRDINALCNDQLSSILLRPGWSVRLYRDPSQSGSNGCVNSNDTNLSDNTFSDGSPMDNAVSSFTTFNVANCGANYSIVGRVINSDNNNNPLQGVTISLSNGSVTLTNSNGDYAFNNLQASSYTLTPSKAGFSFSPSSRVILVPPNSGNQNFSASPQSLFISGQVRDSQNNLLPNVPIHITGLTWQADTTTDLNGYYIFSALVAGYYRVGSPSNSTYELSPLVHTYPLLLTNQGWQDFNIAPHYGSIAGKITDKASGNTLGNASINIGGKTSKSNADGTYLIENILPGVQKVYVSLDGYSAFETNITIIQATRTNLNITLTRLVTDGYRLPYRGGTYHQCTQGTPHWPYNAINYWAYDFGWGQYNAGADYDVVAARDGLVLLTSKNHPLRTGEWYVRILHANGQASYYTHLSEVYVNEGDYVYSGTLIGKQGKTGNADGVHLHFSVFDSAYSWQSVQTKFEDPDLSIHNGTPQSEWWYISDNYIRSQENAFQADIRAVTSDVEPPFGDVQFRLTGLENNYTLHLWGADFASLVPDIRLASTEMGLQTASWTPLTNTVSWNFPTVFAQFRDANKNISQVYSDTVESITYEPLHVAFSLNPTVCVNQGFSSLVNHTYPMCVQCGWLWDFGNGNTSQDIEPSFDDSHIGIGFFGYETPGTYTVTLSVANVNSTSSVSHLVTAIPSPSNAFTITRMGNNTIKVEATEINADSWTWDFGDKTQATGRIVTHLYTDTPQTVPVKLRVTGINGCESFSWQYTSPEYKIYLPFVKK